MVVTLDLTQPYKHLRLPSPVTRFLLATVSELQFPPAPEFLLHEI